MVSYHTVLYRTFPLWHADGHLCIHVKHIRSYSRYLCFSVRGKNESYVLESFLKAVVDLSLYFSERNQRLPFLLPLDPENIEIIFLRPIRWYTKHINDI